MKMRKKLNQIFKYTYKNNLNNMKDVSLTLKNEN